MYKSRTGNHSTLAAAASRSGRNVDHIKEKRMNDRRKAHQAHRHIEPTPMKKIPANRDANNGKQQQQPPAKPNGLVKQEPKENVTAPKKLSRQEEFRQKFQKYRDEKAKQRLAKKAPAPFSSAVPSGRFIDRVKLKDTKVKIGVNKMPMKSVTPKPVPAAQQQPKKANEKNKFSPINTRSRNLALVSPSKLPTPRRKSRKRSIRERDENAAASEVTRQASSTSTEPPSTSSSTSQNKKALSAINVDEVPSIPAEFKFMHTSTVVKKRVETATSGELSEVSSRLVFNESISPIEEPKVPISSQSAKKLESETMVTPETRKPLVKDSVDLNETPVQQLVRTDSANYVSPFVTISRGSRSHKTKEEAARNIKYTLNSRSVLNNSVEERQKKEAALYFRNQVQKETDRLMGQVNEWKAYKSDNIGSIPAEYIDSIDSAIGQTSLLTTNKFKQFSDLIVKCEMGQEEQQPVRPEDLEGFWSMVFIQVENCDKRFQRLNMLRSNNWEDPELKKLAAKKKKPKLNGVSNANNFKAKSNSALSQMLKAARKQFKENAERETATGNRRRSLVLSAVGDEAICQVNKTAKRKSIWVVS